MQVIRVRLLLGIIPLLFSNPLQGSFENQGGGWSAASANIGVVGGLDLNRLINNPALQQRSSRTQFSLNYANPYHGLGIHLGEIVFATDWRNHSIVGKSTYLGDQVYIERTFNMGTSIPLDSLFVAGLSTQYYQVSISDMYTRSTLAFSPSFNFNVTSSFNIGSRIHNLFQVKKEFKVAQRFELGFAYLVQDVQLMLLIEKESAHPLELCFGMEWQTARYLQLAAGFRDVSKTITCGWRLDLPKYSVYYTYQFHPELPDSHGLGFWFEIKR